MPAKLLAKGKFGLTTEFEVAWGSAKIRKGKVQTTGL